MHARLIFQLALITAVGAGCASNQSDLEPPKAATDMTFFITRAGPGHGADLGGLEGADHHCQTLAAAAGSRRSDWKAYLSTQATAERPAVNARDRIGKGPWRNARGVVVARTVEELHGQNNINHDTGLDELGNRVNGREDTPPQHDILTGSTSDGRAFPPDKDLTCRNYTSRDDGSVQVGHFDRAGPAFNPSGTSWNSSHAVGGCSQTALQGRGGAGLLYCFAGSQATRPGRGS